MNFGVHLPQGGEPLPPRTDKIIDMEKEPDSERVHIEEVTGENRVYEQAELEPKLNLQTILAFFVRLTFIDDKPEYRGRSLTTTTQGSSIPV